MADTAALDALVHGSQTPVSFRQLSAHLRIPTRVAQHLLQAYAAAHPPLTILWCVTILAPSGVKRVSLTTRPPPCAVSKTVWAVAVAIPPPTLWLADDAERERRLTAAPSSDVNELRDGRYNPIRSTSSEWRPADATVAAAAVAAGVVAQKSAPKPSLLAAVKEKVKARDARRAKNGKTSSAFKPKSANGGPSLFSTKRLGSAAAEQIRADDDRKKRKGSTTSNGESKGSTKTPVKKGRRLVKFDSDDDEANENGDEDEELDEEEANHRALEKEAAEKEAAEAERAEAERAEAEQAGAEQADEEPLQAARIAQERVDEERAELRREVEELTRKDADEEPQSPELHEIDKVAEKGDDAKSSSPSQTLEGAKRTLNEAFGMPEDPNASGGRRIKKMIEETVEGDDGYIHTKRVWKTYDEEGNEISGGESESGAKSMSAEEAAKIDSTKPPKSTKSQRQTNGSGKSQKKENASNSKRPSSQPNASGGTKKTSKKKGKGNIMSYFGKRG